MEFKEIDHWLKQGKRRQQILLHFSQPSTAKQIAHRHGISLDSCSSAIFDMRTNRLLRCMNPVARRSRLFWLTQLGAKCQHRTRKKHDRPIVKHDIPDIDWDLYGWVCFTHRSAIIRALHGAMQPSAIKRRAYQQFSELKMSANNVRDVIRLFLARGIVCPVRIRKKKHLRYELTETGKCLQALLNRTCY